MAGFIQNMLWNSVEGFVDAAKKTGGEYAGNALIKAGDLIEGGGKSVGNGIERTATGYGSKLSGQTYQPSSASKALPNTARKPVVKRSNSLPANTKPSIGMAGGRSLAGPTSSVPLGAKKAVGGATKTLNGVASGASKTAGMAGRTLAGPTSSVPLGAKKTVGTASRPAGRLAGAASRTTGLAKPLASTARTPVPKPYASTSASTTSSAYPAAKKTAVKPGVSKPFTAPSAASAAKPPAAKPYPGTNTLPGQTGNRPVKRKFTPAPTLGSQVAPGQKMTHIGAF